MAQRASDEPHDKVRILLSWCKEHDIVIHPDLEIVLNEPSTQTSVMKPSTATAIPLVDYSDDDSDDDGYDQDKTMHGKKNGTGHEERYAQAVEDNLIPGIAVIARNFVESGSTVVQIPPSAVLSYANVCGASASTVTAATGNAVFQQSAQQRQRPLPLQQLQAHSTASGASTTVESSQHPALTGREPRSPPATVNERSGVEAEYATNDPSHSIRMTHGTDDAENTSITHYSAPRNMEAIMLSSADATASSLALSLALLSEFIKAEISRWWGYLQSLPAEEPPLAIFWDETDRVLDEKGEDEELVVRERARRRECRRAMRMVAGTQLERYLHSRELLAQRLTIENFFVQIVDPFLRAQPRQAGSMPRSSLARWTLFRRAYALVSSRAFWVDAYHGLALVPIADAFNHTEEHHVHLETDWEVCRVCGALQACEHDEDEDRSSQMTTIAHSFDMVMDRDVHRGDEVFNTYNVESRTGRVTETSGIGNVELLCRYGFLLEGNGADRIVFGEEEVQRFTSASGPAAAVQWSYDDNIVTNARVAFEDAGLVVEGTSSGLQMDAEGGITRALWTRLAQDVLLKKVGARKMPVDSHSTVTSAAADVERVLVQGVSFAVVGLCERRIEEMGDGDDDEGDEVDDVSVVGVGFGARMVTLVGRYVRGERALLEAAVQLWKEFGKSVRSF